jgi:hypothetical protein
MPTTAVNEADVAATELEHVRPRIEELYESDDHFYSSIKKRDVETVSYREMRIPLEIAPGGDFGYFNPDGSDLGRGNGPDWDKATLRPVFLKEGIEYTKLANWATNDRRKAIQDNVRRLTARAIIELRRQLDAQLQQPGDGTIGTITTVSTASGVDTYTLTTDGWGARLVRKNQTVQVYDATLATLRGSGKITLWDVENKTIAVTPNVAGSIATDRLVTQGISSPTSLPALYGVTYHDSNASTGTWLGFNRANFPEVRANRVNGGGSALTLAQPRLAMNKVGNRVGIDKSMKVTAWTHPCQFAAYEEIGQAVIIQNKTSTKDEGLNMYFNDNMQFAGAPGKQHFNWNQKRIDFIVDSVWGRAEILPIGFYQSDGRKIFELRGASGGVATADIFYMVVGFQTFVVNPPACSYIDALAIPSGY